MATRLLRLGVNIDHVATIRNARGGRHPDPVRAARVAAAAGADGITAHLREDRRHISDDDIARLTREIDRPRNEVTTEGGLDAAGGSAHLARLVRSLGDAGIRVSLFIDPETRQLEAARRLGAPVVELHTGAYCDATAAARERELRRLVAAAAAAEEFGLECHAGHGLGFDTVGPVAAIPTIVELNIGHFLVGEAIFGGLDGAVKRMRALMQEARGREKSA